MYNLKYFDSLVEGSDTTRTLKPDTKIVVYHGTNENSLKKMLFGGIDATKVHYRLYNQGKERGLYVTDNLETAKKFGNWIIQFECYGRDLFPTSRYGASKETRSNKEFQKYLEDKYPTSFRKYTSYMLDNAIEPQAMFIGYIPVKNISKIYNFKYGDNSKKIKEYDIEEVIKMFDLESFDWDLNMSIEDIFKKITEIYGVDKETLIGIMKTPYGLEEVLNLVEMPRKLELRVKEYIGKV